MEEKHKNSHEKNTERNWMKLALGDRKYLSQTIIVIKTEEHSTGLNR